MKKDISKLITEQQFWQFVEQARQNITDNVVIVDSITQVLEQLTQDEIAGYHYWNMKFDRQAYTSDLWCVVYIVMGGCGDDQFMDFRHWLVLQGETIYKNAIKNPDSLSDIFDSIADGDIPLIEAYEVTTAFENKYDSDFDEYCEEHYTDIDYNLPEINFSWTEDDEESMKKVCPNTFEKWWDNMRF